MSEAWWLTAAAALSVIGMAWLALAMAVHWEQVMGQVMQRPAEAAAQTRRVLRVLGGLALGLSLVACLLADRPSMAALVWVMLLAFAAASVAMLLAWRARWLRVLAGPAKT